MVKPGRVARGTVGVEDGGHTVVHITAWRFSPAANSAVAAVRDGCLTMSCPWGHAATIDALIIIIYEWPAGRRKRVPRGFQVWVNPRSHHHIFCLRRIVMGANVEAPDQRKRRGRLQSPASAVATRRPAAGGEHIRECRSRAAWAHGQIRPV